ncbi:MAG: 23S rRNA (adenine(2503)-C(2))-methyltransferase RlmN [Anaerolineaceae bacterium]|nr:23S rRNA (adenine(2503)-C(2))-methyltransferase RlmN [Anaerolineaceae bacterium]
MNNFFDFTFDEMVQFFSENGLQKFRVKQLWQGMYKELKTHPSEITTLSKSLTDQLGEFFTFSNLKTLQISASSDGETEKALLELPDQNAIETVRMSYHKRETICISTQVGCAMNCGFCATGKMGLMRNLSAGEIVEQVIIYQRYLALEDKKVTNIVFMGMGEPFHNYGAFIKAANIINAPEGLQLGERRMTVSTVGLPDLIRKFADETRQINLAISLHSANNEKRSNIVPINKKYPIHELLSACKYYLQKTNRRITFEYAIMRGYNDTANDAKQLAFLLKGLLCHVNLINLNPIPGSKYQPTSSENAKRFQAILEEAKIPVSMRLRRGIDINAGCGQLANQNKRS